MQVTAAAWEPLAALRTLSLTLPRSLSRESTDDLVRACGSLRTLTLQYPAGSVDTSYLMRHVEHMGSLQRLEVTAQRVLFSAGFGGGAGGEDLKPLHLPSQNPCGNCVVLIFALQSLTGLDVEITMPLMPSPHQDAVLT